MPNHFLDFLKAQKALFEPRRFLLLVALYSGGLILFAMGLARVANLVPCPLCIVQRFFYALVGLAALVGYMGWWQRFTVRWAGLSVAVFSFMGWLVAARHVYIQNFPSTELSSGCAVSFGSFLDDLIFALGGTGNCAIVDWTLLSLSIPEWSLIAFTGLTFVGVWIYRTADRFSLSYE